MPLPSKAEFFREVTIRISSSLNVAEALAATYDYLHQVIPTDRIGLYYYERDEANLYAVAEAAADGIKEFDDAAPLMRFDKDAIEFLKERVLREPTETVFRQNLARAVLPASLRYFLSSGGDSSLLHLYLRIKESLLGVLILFRSSEEPYTTAEEKLMETVQMPIAIAMSNARLYRETMKLQRALKDDNRHMAREIQNFTGSQVVGAEFGLRHVMEMVRNVAPLSSPVLLMGETGTGKEVIANVIHLSSPRQDKPMVRVPCGAIPDSLLSSELFGHEKGAFTGAIQSKRGSFERANGGSIFLDEIGELTAEAQVKLLRVLQEKEFERLGSERTTKVDVRIIAATHRNLEEMVRAGQFREDLWFRLNVFPIHLPPLRLRKEDIPSLVHFFAERKSREMGLGMRPTIPEDEIENLFQYDWPGNVRELQNVIERALILNPGGALNFGFLKASHALPGAASPVTADLHEKVLPLNEALANHIRLALRCSGGRVEGAKGAATLLRLHPSTLRSKMKKLGLVPPAP